MSSGRRSTPGPRSPRLLTRYGDVFFAFDKRPEPLPADSPLRDLRNVILTAHNVGHTRELFGSMGRALVENLMALASGRAPVITRNPEVLDAWRARWEVAA